MRAPRDSVASRIVALAWAMGHIGNADVRALLGLAANHASTYLCGALRRGYLEELPGHRPKQFGLTADRLAAINSMPNLLALRTQAEQLAQVTRRVRALRAATEAQAKLARRAARGTSTTARRAAKAAARAAARAEDKAANTQARLAAKARAQRQPTAAQRPPSLPGSKLVVAARAGQAAPITGIEGAARRFRDAPAQDPLGLLTPSPAAPPAPQPYLLRGGHLAPADGPYIRPGSMAPLAVPSRRGDALVAHRAPLSQP